MIFKINVLANRFNINKVCPFCLGTGKLKVMRSVTIYTGSIRGNDKQIKCKYCNGTGIKEVDASES